MLIIIEGSDFAGKSTVTKLVVENLVNAGYIARSTSTCLSQGLMSRIVDYVQNITNRKSLLKPIIFHLAYVWDAVAWRLPFESIQIQESYILRVIAFAIANNLVVSRIMLSLIQPFSPKAQIAFFLHCDFEVRKQRYQESNSMDPRDYHRFNVAIENNKLLDCRLQELARENNYIFIDTASNLPHRTAEIIVSSIIDELDKKYKSPL